MPPVRRALLPVSDKTGLIELARALVQRGIELLSTGGTARALAAADTAAQFAHTVRHFGCWVNAGAALA